MASFEVDKEIEKDVFRLVTNLGQRKDSESPRGIEIPRSDALPLSLRDSSVSEVYYEFHMTRVLHSGISNVDSVMFINRIREMVSFELGKEIEKDVFSSCHERGTKKKILSSHEESNLRPSDSALRCSTTTPACQNRESENNVDPKINTF